MERVSGGRTRVWFGLQRGIPPSRADGDYTVYYSTQVKRRSASDARRIFAFFDDFTGDALNFGRWVAESKSSYAIHRSALLIDKLGETDGRSDWHVEEVISAELDDTESGFRIDYDLQYDAPEGSLFAFWVQAGLSHTEPASVSADEVQDYLGLLESPDWTEREGAHDALVKMGLPVLEMLPDSPALTADVKARFSQIRGEIESNERLPDLWMGLQNISDNGAVVAGGVGEDREHTPGRILLNEPFRFSLIKLADGTVRLVWNDKRLHETKADGELNRISINAGQFDGYRFGTCKINRIRIRPAVAVEPDVVAMELERKR
jgi:hypothetical protein